MQASNRQPPAVSSHLSHRLLSSSLQTDAHFRLLVESVQDYAIFLLDPLGNVATWNDGAKRIKGYEAEEIVGRHFSVFYPPEDVANGKPQRELESAAHDGRVEDEGWRVRRDSTRFRANVVITALHDQQGELIGFAKVTRDITDRLRLAELQHARELSAHVRAALENERATIARELHDDLGQQLAALKMQLARLDWPGAPGESVQRKPAATLALQTQIDGIISSVRRIAAGLRPPLLDELGLYAAIEWLVSDVSRHFGLCIRLKLEGEEPKFECAAATSLFRILQEALTNIVRHAQASDVDVVVAADESIFSLNIEDDGRGASLDVPRAADAFGLLGMGERVHQLGGVITFDSQPDEGFRIGIEVPLKNIVTSIPK
ncbi:PAS domain-containing sensor histidine kinase [Caballeronia sp. BR00000012568055]|uniref:PAS domain-containing sensor histidine kinase n=1 Tax=Caballeronia sp. BR00000012568055 TaxID=2918761 RepID=UPI0023F70F22|nr:PAS domain-containing sensor histidine kinase [Caballeronia sp. BR00000012568055]